MWGNKENYLAAALNVVYGVKEKVPFGASNRLSDFVESYDRHHKKVEGANPGVVDKVMGGMTAFLPLMTGANRAVQIYDEIAGNASLDKLERYRQIANLTVKMKAGNCFEQAIVAFIDLYDRGIRPVAIMYMDNRRHAFVLIGRPSRTENHPSKWGDECVVCDPWAREAYYLPADTGAGILQTKWGCPTATAEFGVA